MFRASAPAASSSQPPAPASTSVADFQQDHGAGHTTQESGCKGAFEVGVYHTVDFDEQMFQATHRSTYEQLLEQIARRAKGRNAVDYYEEGMTPLLAYMFFVLHYHESSQAA